MLLGAHVSVAGGLEHAPAHGKTLGAEAIQIFTRNQRTWRHRPLCAAEVAAFRAARAAAGTRAVLAHGSYLLNLAAADPAILRRSRAALLAEIERCRRLGVDVLVVHPGAHGGRGEAAGVRAVAASLDWALEHAGGTGRVTLALETTAGQGHSLGHRFEHLRDILGRLRRPAGVAVCIDTCHVFAAGYELRSAGGYEETLAALGRTVGLDRVAAIHLNDSRGPLGSRRDRHVDLGAGELGIRVFTRLVRDRRLSGLPAVLETPGGMAIWKRDIARLERARRCRPARARTEGTKRP